MLNLNEYISVGQNFVVTKVVETEDIANTYLGAFKYLLSTPRLMHWALDASVETIDPYLPKDYASIGISFNFVHTAPTCAGMTVTVHVTIIDITEHDVLLSIKAWDEQGEIAHGTHKRAIVEIAQITKKAEERKKIISSRRILSWAKDK